jgi:hypothetical protein
VLLFVEMLQTNMAVRSGALAAIVLTACIACGAHAGPTGAAGQASGCGTPKTANKRKPFAVPAFSAKSPFNQKIPKSARVAPDSPQKVARIVDVTSRQPFVVALRRWSVPVFIVRGPIATQRVRLLASWAPRSFEVAPIPANAQPDPAGDGHMAVIDLANRCEYDFIGARHDGGGWVSGWANSLSLDGTGIYPRGLSTRASGFALLAGLIFPQELARGAIRHALVFSYPYTKSNASVSPATEATGATSDPLALPMGTLLRLNPALDLRTLPLTPYERIIARALQVYGMYLGDTGGGLSIYAANPLSSSARSYTGLLPDEDYPSLGNIPLSQLQIIEPLRSR